MDDNLDFADLIRRIRAGEDEAAADLVRRFEPEIRREVRMRLRVRDSRLRRVFDSMDIVQSVLQSFFLRAAAGQYDLDDPAQLRGLLAAMARNKLVEHVRHQQRDRRDVRRTTGNPIEEMATAGVDTSPTASRVIAGRELLGEFHRRLSDEERRLADLRTDGRTWAEVAAEVGGTPEGRRKQFARMVDRIAKELDLADPASSA